MFDTLCLSLLLLPFAFFWCCCGCGSGNLTDSFSSVDPNWEIDTGSGTFLINSGRLELTSTGNLVIKRCRNAPASSAVTTIKVKMWHTQNIGNQYLHFRTSDYSDLGFGLMENVQYTIIFSAAFIGFSRYVVNYINFATGTGNTGAINTGSAAPVDGDELTIEITDIGSGLVDMEFFINGVSIYTLSSKPWVWQNRAYIVFQQSGNGSTPIKSQWDDLSLTV